MRLPKLMLSGNFVTFTLLAMLGNAEAADPCRVQAHDTDSIVQDYRAATRNVSSSCTKEGSDCEGAKSAAVTALGDVIDAHEALLNECVGSNPPPPPASPPTLPGDLVITEIMVDPASVDDGNGEWFEIYNPTTTDFQLMNLVVRDDYHGEYFTIDSPLVIPASGFVVLGNNSDPLSNGGVSVDFQYPSYFVLGNIAVGSGERDVVEIFNGTTSIDRVEYATEWSDPSFPPFPSSSGKAMSLDPSHTNDSANDLGWYWCDAVDMLPGGDFGTPGAANPPCL